ncbi:MAG TPA: putative lipid II flippase FtsW [Herpetosiphon sp.]|uniref:Probable peptidoglycan glycosyltransferase FtsW n=1 Tax=Herpetosiphon aurantiacus (strain ATCC 23779 / DSM 785 / 114-95) TaxID=316274 RepID=A9B511_HERA2|nr:putative lipid II flippase FtsW [Herpetosiphon sp.]ABX06148.1 cell division protein FtsW [Herpetosiphon aurantiacus DSM 785]HBW51338.1 putative lipid II flippase FtsW [Herpetosiphon sp.]
MNDRVPRKPDGMLLALVGGLVAFGLVMVYSSSFYVAYAEYGSSVYWVLRQTMWAIAGVGAMIATMRFDYRKLRRFSLPLMLITLFLLLLVLLLPEHITKVNGASRWINIGPVGMQPSEIAKFAAIIYFADWLSRRGSKIRQFVTGLLPFGIMLGLLAGLVLLQPNMSTTIVIVVISAAILFTSGASLTHLGIAASMTTVVGWLAIQSAGYRALRVLVWQDPFSYPRDGGYQPIHALYALGSGSWTGVGLGQSRQKFFWLPFAHTDAIYAVIGEELGIIGAGLVLAAFVVLAVRGFRIASRTLDPFGALIAVGVTTWLVVQALINIAVVTTVIPFTGITLPFISYGGSSLMMTMIAAGLLLSVTRYAPLKRAEERTNELSIPTIGQLRPRVVAAADAVRRWHGRPRVSGFGGGQRPEENHRSGSFAVGNSLGGTWRKPADESKRLIAWRKPKQRKNLVSQPINGSTARERIEQRRRNKRQR